MPEAWLGASILDGTESMSVVAESSAGDAEKNLPVQSPEDVEEIGNGPY